MPESTTDPAVELVALIAKALVDEPDAVDVRMSKGGKAGGVLELSVEESDLGKIIGKKGRTAKSIRTVLNSFGEKRKRRYALDILEP
jgi:predicted RNA-binding protein YlqC (UPF0109 family)